MKELIGASLRPRPRMGQRKGKSSQCIVMQVVT